MDFSIIVPVVIALTQIAKMIPAIPVTKQNAGMVVASVSAIIVIVAAINGGYIKDADMIASNFGILIVLIYGFYETIKQFVGLLKSLFAKIK